MIMLGIRRILGHVLIARGYVAAIINLELLNFLTLEMSASDFFFPLVIGLNNQLLEHCFDTKIEIKSTRSNSISQI
jgi:hypothetical protein